MQHIESVIAVASGIVAAGVGYGVAKASIARLEKDVERIWMTFDAHVKRAHFDAVVEQIHQNQSDLKSDLKQILAILSQRER